MYNIRLYTFIVLLILTLKIKCDSNKIAHINTAVLLDEHYNQFYVAYVELGAPLKTLTLQVSFEESDIILFKERSSYNSYSLIENEDGTFKEVLYTQSYMYYVPLVFDYSKRYSLDKNFYINQNTVGIIGFSRTSIFWKLWNQQITFTPKYIEFGYPETVNNLMISSLNSKEWHEPNSTFIESHRNRKLINCEDNINHICAFKVYLKSNDGDGYASYKEYKMIFNFQLLNSYIPDDVYNNYMRNKNVYNRAREEWEDIHFLIPSKDEEDIYFSNVKFSSELFISEKRNGIKQLLINKLSTQMHYKEIPDDTFIMGMNFLDDKVIHKNELENYIIMYSLNKNDHVSFLNLAIFFILLFLFLRWKLTDGILKSHPNDDSTYYYNVIGFVFEIAGILLSFVSYVVPSTQESLRIYPTINIFILMVFVFCVFTECMSIWFLLMVTQQPTNTSILIMRRDTNMNTQANILRNLSHDTLLLYGLWLIILERTKIDLTILPTVLINCYVFYNLSFYGIQMVLYNTMEYKIYKEFYKSDFKKYKLLIIMYLLTIFPFIYIFQMILTANYFLKPYLTEKASYLDDINTQLVIIIMLFIFICSNHKSVLYTRKHLLNTAK
jgi:hypothetical protein